ncbi:hypothetical protein FPHOBKDP_00145 [Listeria phage LPJP1]|nr:hypothetical protein FPHOBKDP_00145 [Listeria phage LPJP1]
MVMLNATVNEEYKRENVNEIITNISEDIMIDNILSQINDTDIQDLSEVRKSFFEYFEERYNFVKKNYNDDDEAMQNCREVFDDILNQIIKAISEKYSFDLFFSDILLFDTKVEITKSLYYFFVINIRENIENMIYYFIMKNRKTLVKMFNTISKEERKNLSYINLSSAINNDYTTMIYHLSMIIDNIEIPTNEDIIELMVEDNSYELYNYVTVNTLVLTNFCEVNYNENFYSIFLDIIKNSPIIVRNVRNSLIDSLK